LITINSLARLPWILVYRSAEIIPFMRREMKIKLIITIVFIILISCDDDKSEVDKFNEQLAEITCNTVLDCCKENDSDGIYDGMNHEKCVSEVLEDYRKVFDEKYFEVDKSKLEDVLTGFKDFYNGNCEKSMDQETEKEIQNLFLTAFIPKLHEGDECTSALACIDGYCKPEREGKYLCSPYGGVGDPCGINYLCSSDLICVATSDGYYCDDLKVGDSCVENKCGFDGKLSCDTTTLKCVETGEIGDSCYYDVDCKSLDCVEGVCDIYDIVDAQCLN
jgi:hypothetical protein